jgi:hypothetical protein
MQGSEELEKIEAQKYLKVAFIVANRIMLRGEVDGCQDQLRLGYSAFSEFTWEGPFPIRSGCIFNAHNDLR